MGKFLVRFTIIFVSVLLLLGYSIAMLYGIDIISGNHVVLFELICVVYCYSEGKYHCEYIKHTALGIFFSDVLTRADLFFDFLSVEEHNLIPISILATCIAISTTKAFIHFHKVRKLKRRKRENFTD